eukprot:gene14375-30610_t
MAPWAVTGDSRQRAWRGSCEVPLGGSQWPNVLHRLQQASGLVGVEGYTFTVSGRRFGNAILSRYPIVATRRIDLSFCSREPRGAVDADIYCHGTLLRVVATHLGLRAAERRAQISTLLQAFDTAEMPVILMGDCAGARDLPGALALTGAGPDLDQATAPAGARTSAYQPDGEAGIRSSALDCAYRRLVTYLGTIRAFYFGVKERAMTQTFQLRTCARSSAGVATSDGAGVRLRRSLGSGEGTRLDPFLMLDEFSSENPGDYIAGFP